jgi:hypothetical protein
MVPETVRIGDGFRHRFSFLPRGCRMIQRVLVLGGGSAGFLAAISLKIKLPDLSVSVVRSKDMGVIGVGEATTFAFPNYLHGRLKIESGEVHRNAQPTWKPGIRFLNWGPRRHFDYTFRPQGGVGAPRQELVPCSEKKPPRDDPFSSRRPFSWFQGAATRHDNSTK